MRRKTGRIGLAVCLALWGVAIRGEEPKAEAADASRSVQLSLRVGKNGRELWLPGKTRAVLDAEAAALFLQAGVQGGMRTQPLGVTLPFGPPNQLLTLAYNAEKKQAEVLMHKSPVTSLKVDLTNRHMPFLILIRQRDQLALWSLPPVGGKGVLIKLMHVDYVLCLRPIRDYGLCEGVTYAMGERKLTADEFGKGIELDCLDEVKDVTVSGADPWGKPFTHAYKLDHSALLGRLDKVYEDIPARIRQEWQGK